MPTLGPFFGVLAGSPVLTLGAHLCVLVGEVGAVRVAVAEPPAVDAAAVVGALPLAVRVALAGDDCRRQGGGGMIGYN